MSVRILLSAAVTGLLLGGAAGAAPAKAQQPLASDSSFIQAAASAGLLQVRLGKLAEKKGSSAGVKEFGKRMVADYSKTNEELKEAAKQAAFPRPVLLRQHQQIVDRFVRMGGSSFDQAYMTEVVKQHSEEVELYRQQSETGRVQSLKQLAARLLPELERRQALATQTAGLVGADITASSAEAQRK